MRSSISGCGPDQPPEYREAIVKTNLYVRKICRFYLVYTVVNATVYIVAPATLTFHKYFTWNNSTEPMYFNFHNEYAQVFDAYDWCCFQ